MSVTMYTNCRKPEQLSLCIQNYSAHDGATTLMKNMTFPEIPEMHFRAQNRFPRPF